MKKMSWLLIATVGLAGCVSAGKYKKLEADNKAQIAAAQKELADAKQSNAALTQEMDDLKRLNSTLNTQADDLKKANEESKAEYKNMMGKLQQEVSDGNLKVTQYQNMLTVNVAEKLFFDSGSATLKKSGQVVLKKVGEALSQYKDKVIRVVGHTDNIPLGKKYQEVFPSNWELSVMRATNVVRFLQDECAIAPENLVASGRGQYEPVAPNDTPEGRQKNRRIEIMLIDKSMVAAMQTPQSK